jgi:hypothetical protein
MQLSPSSEAISCSDTQEFSKNFMKSGGSLPCSQEPIICLYPEPNGSSRHLNPVSQRSIQDMYGNEFENWWPSRLYCSPVSGPCESVGRAVCLVCARGRLLQPLTHVITDEHARGRRKWNYIAGRVALFENMELQRTCLPNGKSLKGNNYTDELHNFV